MLHGKGDMLLSYCCFRTFCMAPNCSLFCSGVTKMKELRRITISGGQKLSGTIPIEGSKNAALIQLSACLLTDEWVALKNVPNLTDITSMISLLEEIGVQIKQQTQFNVMAAMILQFVLIP